MTPQNPNLTEYITKEELEINIKFLGKKISVDYPNMDIIMIGILKGCVVFLADLIREIEIPSEIDFLELSSYGSGKE